MGSSLTKDNNINIFMLTNKEFYRPGEYVEGEIYMRVAQPTHQYQKLIINLHGKEQVYWTEGSSDNQSTYSNQYDSYDSSFVIMDFRGKLKKNDYVFHFAFLLPSMISGTFLYSPSCYLKYTLKAQLVHRTELKKNQFYQMFLNIIETPRIKPGPTTMTLEQNSKCCEYCPCFKCCCCCSDYGPVSVTLNSNKNFIMNGDIINVNGVIDNTRGTKEITRSRIFLQRRICLIQSRGYMTNYSLESIQLYQIGPIQARNRYNFNFTATIPETLNECTAIGNIMSLYYVLHLYTDYGCCAKNADVQLHLIFNSKIPKIISPQTIPQPQNWHPQKMEKVICQNMNPYVYTPHPKLPFTNFPANQMMNEQTMVSNNYQNKLYPDLNEEHQTWESNSYKPVFVNDQATENTQRDMIYKSDEQSQKAIIRKL